MPTFFREGERQRGRLAGDPRAQQPVLPGDGEFASEVERRSLPVLVAVAFGVDQAVGEGGVRAAFGLSDPGAPAGHAAMLADVKARRLTRTRARLLASSRGGAAHPRAAQPDATVSARHLRPPGGVGAGRERTMPRDFDPTRLEVIRNALDRTAPSVRPGASRAAAARRPRGSAWRRVTRRTCSRASRRPSCAAATGFIPSGVAAAGMTPRSIASRSVFFATSSKKRSPLPMP